MVRPDLRTSGFGSVEPARHHLGAAIAARDRLLRVGRRRDRRGTPPPAGAFERVEQVGRAWIAWLERQALGRGGLEGDPKLAWSRGPGPGGHPARTPEPDRLTVRETWDPGWTARLDGSPSTTEHGPGPFMTIRVSNRSA